MNSDKVIVSDLGHLQLFKKTTLEHPMGDGHLYYYDKRFPYEIGPFKNYSEAVSHWKSIVERKTPDNKTDNLLFLETSEEAVPDNVIYVDFQAKRRIK